MGKNYDILEAYEILRRQQLVRFPLGFSEELPYADGVFTYEGREKLFTKLCALGAERFVAIYTSDPFVLTIGCYKGKPFMIDTHPVAPPFGNGNGLLLIGTLLLLLAGETLASETKGSGVMGFLNSLEFLLAV